MFYLATSQVLDPEFQSKVALHQSRRSDDWILVEEPLDLGPALADLPAAAICLVDCATMWLSNQMMAERDLGRAQADLIAALSACPAELVIVSNEVGMGIVPDNALARGFREAQGRLNIALARHADRVAFVAAGLPMMLKGSLP